MIPMTDGSETVQESVSLHSELGRRSSESDETETIDSRANSEADEEAGRVVVDDTIEDPEVDIPGPRGVTLREAFASLDGVDPRVNFEKRAAVMKSIPKFLRGPFRNALKLALEEATTGDDVRAARGSEVVGDVAQNVASSSARRGGDCEGLVGGSVSIILAR